jgi:hypothetical protein
MGTIISIYLIVALGVVFIKILFKFSFWTLFYALLLPALPFLVAYKNWKIKPVQSKMIVALYGLLYLMLLLILLIETH